MISSAPVRHAPPTETHGELALSTSELRLFQDLMYREAGIRLPDVKQNLVQGRLRKRLDALGLGSYREYHSHITAHGHADELQRCLEALTTNETFFFRHKQHWDFLLEELLPAWQRGAARGASFRVWSAASSTGEEPYSLAIALHAALSGHGFGIHIDATDINTQVLARARTGIYGAYALQKLTPKCLQQYFVPAGGDDHFQVREDIRALVAFRSHNLQEATVQGPPYDLIMLRNVLIYFDTASKNTVIGHIGTRLRAGGHLILGGAETLSDVHSSFTYVRPTIYRKH